jgi:hypothetical protein
MANDDVRKRISDALSQTFSYWYVYQVKKYGGWEIDSVEHLWGPLYTVNVTLHLWNKFQFTALYLDGDGRGGGHPALFIDTWTLSFLVEEPMLNHYELQDVERTVERVLLRHGLIDESQHEPQYDEEE